MSGTTVEEKIRARAYELWQLDGGLEGCADEYSRTARALVEKEMTAPDSAKPGDPDVRAPD